MVEAEQDKNHTFLAVYHILQKRMVQLADPLIKEVTTIQRGNADVALGYNTLLYERERGWTGISIRDYYLIDEETGMHYLIELKIGGDLDNKKARSEKEALLEQYCILANNLGSEEKVRIYFATAYNRYGEEKSWKQGRVLQFFSEDELKIGRDFWNMVCKTEKGYEIVLDEYKKNAHFIIDALNKIKKVYLPND